MIKQALSLYVHIPFCKRKCKYCDFLSFGGCSIAEQKEYIDALCKEIGAYSLISENDEIVTIFIGGGTPSYIPAEYIGRVLKKVRETFTVSEDAEITIEGNPDSLTSDNLKGYMEYGINRLSIGLQSANNDMLIMLGRVHNYDQFVAAYSRAREVGFSNINIDIMSGLPSESMESYVKTLGRVVEMQPEHISAYSLIVEEGTPLAEDEELLSKLPSEEIDRRQYSRTKLLLGQAGYERYEISNYAKKGYECRHNLRYWTGGEYLGVGLGASSYMIIKDSSFGSYVNLQDDIDEAKELLDYDISLNDEDLHVRFKGVDNIDEYIGRFSRFGSGWTDLSSAKELIGNCYTDIMILKDKDRMEEFMFLGLRCIKGISISTFEEKFGKNIYEVYGSIIEKYTEWGYLIIDEDRIYLSDKGIDVSNTIMAEFLL